MLTSLLISLGTCYRVGSCQQEQVMGWEDVSHAHSGCEFPKPAFHYKVEFYLWQQILSVTALV